MRCRGAAWDHAYAGKKKKAPGGAMLQSPHLAQLFLLRLFEILFYFFQLLGQTRLQLPARRGHLPSSTTAASF